MGPKNDVWMQDLGTPNQDLPGLKKIILNAHPGMLPVIEARTNATSGNVLLLFDVADSPNHRLVPVGTSRVT